MHDQQQADKTTVEISMTLLVFLIVAALGAVPVVLVHQFIDSSDSLLNALTYVVVGCAVAVATMYLWRHRRP